MSLINDVRSSGYAKMGPIAPATLTQYLKDILTGPIIGRPPILAVRQALDVVTALEFLDATDVSVSISTRSVLVTWALRDVLIETSIDDRGGWGHSGRGVSPGTPQTNLSTAIKAISGAMDVLRYQNMMANLRKA
jgi:hypothetical protein